MVNLPHLLVLLSFQKELGCIYCNDTEKYPLVKEEW